RTSLSRTVFFTCYRHPRHLHSFPTRRSSDLGHAQDQGVKGRGERAVRTVEHQLTLLVDARRRDMARMMTALAVIVSMIAMITVTDRKSTRLNSSHVKISYAVFCLKKKTKM